MAGIVFSNMHKKTEMKKVFVADDDFGYLYQLNKLFTRKGFYVRTFSHSQSLFDALEESLPDLVMLDMNLNGENGKEICKEIKSRYNNSVSVILSSDNQSSLKNTDFFADGIFYKPFEIKQIDHLIDTCLSQ